MLQWTRHLTGKYRLGVALATVILTFVGALNSAHAADTQGTYSLLGKADASEAVLDPDDTDVELGVKFSVSTSGTLDAIRFLKAPGDINSRDVTVWTSRGIKLASQQSSNESTSGWQNIPLAKPVKLTAGSSYTVAYNAKRYMATANFFDQPVIRGPLKAKAGQNGVYSYGTGGMPTSTYRSSNYWIDIAFKTDGLKTTTTAPILSTMTTRPAASTTTSISRATPETTSKPPALSPTTVVKSTPAAGKNCAPNPHLCGFPDSTNTGVPAGTQLRAVPGSISAGPGWHYDSRGWIEVDGDGAVVDGIDTALNVDVTASKVIIRNSDIHPSGDTWGVSLRHNVNNVTIENSTIHGTCVGSNCTNRLMVGIRDIYGDATNVTVERNNIYGMDTGVYIETGLIKDNYIHDFAMHDGDHVNGFENAGTTSRLLISHNTIFNQFSQTDAIMLCHDFGTEANKTVDNNLLAGGGWTLYGGDTGVGNFKSNHIVITNNRFAKRFYPNGGAFGPIASFDSSASGNVMSGNVWDDSGAAL